MDSRGIFLNDIFNSNKNNNNHHLCFGAFFWQRVKAVKADVNLQSEHYPVQEVDVIRLHSPTHCALIFGLKKCNWCARDLKKKKKKWCRRERFIEPSPIFLLCEEKKNDTHAAHSEERIESECVLKTSPRCNSQRCLFSSNYNTVGSSVTCIYPVDLISLNSHSHTCTFWIVTGC